LTTLLMQDLILRHFGVAYHPHYLSQLLDRLGFSFQKARFVSPITWMKRPGRPGSSRLGLLLLRQAQEKQALTSLVDSRISV
jgi:hypothetical protein